MKQIYWMVAVLCCCTVIGCATHYQHKITKIAYRNHSIPTYWSSDSILHFPKAEIIDSSIVAVLDTIININSRSLHHNNGEKTWFNIAEDYKGDTVVITIYSNQYDGLMLNWLSNQVSYGAFFYKGFLFERRKTEADCSTFFRIILDSIPVQHYYSNAKIYNCTKEGEQYSNIEMCIVEALFLKGTLFRLDCQTYCPEKSWSILFDVK